MALKNTQTCDRYSGHFYCVLLDESVTTDITTSESVDHLLNEVLQLSFPFIHSFLEEVIHATGQGAASRARASSGGAHYRASYTSSFF